MIIMSFEFEKHDFFQMINEKLEETTSPCIRKEQGIIKKSFIIKGFKTAVYRWYLY